MDRDTFNQLNHRIIFAVGEPEFKSENYISLFLNDKAIIFNKEVSMFKAHKKTSGGFIPGEVKLAIALRPLAGGSALDLSVIFDVSESHCKIIFIKVLKDWIIKPNVGGIDIESYLKDKDRMKTTSNVFSMRSGGFLKGTIGVIDGWSIHIQRPTL